MKVLIADDDALTCEMLEELLPDEGHEVRTVHDGAAALENLAAWKPDVLLCDLCMPGVSGRDLIDMIGHDSRLGRPRIIVFTATREADGPRAGISRVLNKPVEPRVLLDAIEGRQ